MYLSGWAVSSVRAREVMSALENMASQIQLEAADEGGRGVPPPRGGTLIAY